MHYNLLAAAAINPSARLLVALLFCCSCALSLQPLVTTRGACDIPSDSKVCPDACLAALAEIKNVADEVRWFARQDASALVAGSCHPDGMREGIPCCCCCCHQCRHNSSCPSTLVSRAGPA